MKKLLMMMLAAVLGVAVANAAERYTQDVNVLPQTAQATIAKYFAKAGGVNHIKIDKHFLGGVDYEVTLNDGTEIDFNKDGVWTEIDCGSKGVPAAIVPTAIAKHVSSNYTSPIVQIEQKHGKYKIELLNGLDLVYSQDGNFISIEK